ncbi:MAG: histidinol-phosphate transaminase [Chloroflexi bacterium RBG_13_56_8]|nr:MAG: histidinol-phosphate transaminase [Chloroflexi bacterium RBG_13_56_8]
MKAGFVPRNVVGGRVRGIREYAPEPLEELAVRLGMPVEQLIKLDANENPYGPTERTLEALRGYAYFHRYPDALSRRLRQAIGDFTGADPSCILVGNGSDELIDLILKLFRQGKDGVGISQLLNCPPTFGMYQFYGVTNDMEVVEFPRDGDFQVNVGAVEALCRDDPRPRILFLASPNNPDGQLLSDAHLERLLELPLIVVLDEAYVDFSGGSKVGLVAERENLIVLRTFSKWAGLAGLRVGYGVFPEPLMDALWRLKSPYNVNCAAQVAALATLEDVETALARVRTIISERERLLENLRKIVYLKVYDSEANYLLCRMLGVPVSQVREAMGRRGIILRYFDGSALGDCVRITVGTPAQNDLVLSLLRELQGEEIT